MMHPLQMTPNLLLLCYWCRIWLYVEKGGDIFDGDIFDDETDDDGHEGDARDADETSSTQSDIGDTAMDNHLLQPVDKSSGRHEQPDTDDDDPG